MEEGREGGVRMVTGGDRVSERVCRGELRGACRRPWSARAPALGVRLVSRFIMNTDPELALLGRRCVPTRLVNEHGFAFEFPEIGGALSDLL